jgi:hypothetical protein
LSDFKFSVVSVCKAVGFYNYKSCKFAMLIKCGCSLFRTILFLTSSNCKAPKMSSLQFALSLQPCIWSCCTYIVSFAICWMHLFDFSITMLYVFSYLIICACCPNRCLGVVICATGTNLFHDIELEVSFGESIYFIFYIENLCNTSSSYPRAFSSYIFVCSKSLTCNSCFKFGQLHVTSNVLGVCIFELVFELVFRTSIL